jgi:hypothetical protein
MQEMCMVSSDFQKFHITFFLHCYLNVVESDSNSQPERTRKPHHLPAWPTFNRGLPGFWNSLHMQLWCGVVKKQSKLHHHYPYNLGFNTCKGVGILCSTVLCLSAPWEAVSPHFQMLFWHNVKIKWQIYVRCALDEAKGVPTITRLNITRLNITRLELLPDFYN